MLKILVVDDDPIICQMYALALKNAGYKVITAGGAIQGLKLALEELPAIIISDYSLPDQDGKQFCKAVRDHDQIASAHFITVTGKGSEELKVDGLSKLFDDYLEKPVDIPYLVAKINATARRMDLAKI